MSFHAPFAFYNVQSRAVDLHWMHGESAEAARARARSMVEQEAMMLAEAYSRARQQDGKEAALTREELVQFAESLGKSHKAMLLRAPECKRFPRQVLRNANASPDRCSSNAPTPPYRSVSRLMCRGRSQLVCGQGQEPRAAAVGGAIGRAHAGACTSLHSHGGRGLGGLSRGV